MNKLTEQQDCSLNTDELIEKAKEYILGFAGESSFYYEENDTEDDSTSYGYCLPMPKPDEYARYVEQVAEVKIISSKILGYCNRDNLSSVFVQAQLTFLSKEREENENFEESQEIKNYILWFEGDENEPYEYAEKDIHGWPKEFDWLKKELEGKC